MTPNDFVAWVTGYIDGMRHQDLEVIRVITIVNDLTDALENVNSTFTTTPFINTTPFVTTTN